MSYFSTTVDIYVQDVLDELDDEDLLDEVEKRGLNLLSVNADDHSLGDLLTKIWYNKRMNKDYTRELEDLIYYGIGKII